MRPAIRRQETGDRRQEAPENRSRIKTTGESIVREFRIAGRGARVEIPVDRRDARPTNFERVVRIFLILAAGWLFGYLHHFLALLR